MGLIAVDPAITLEEMQNRPGSERSVKAGIGTLWWLFVARAITFKTYGRPLGRLPRGLAAIEYRHSPDPGDIDRVTRPMLKGGPAFQKDVP